MGLDVARSHRFLDTEELALERAQVVERPVRRIGPEIVAVDAHAVSGYAVPSGQLGDAAKLLPVDLEVACELHLEVVHAEDAVLIDEEACLPGLVVAEHRGVHVRSARRRQAEQRLDALLALSSEQIEQRGLDRAPDGRRRVDIGAVPSEPAAQRIETRALGLDGLVPRAQPLPARGPRLPGHVGARTALAVTTMLATRGLHPHAFTVSARGGRLPEGRFEGDSELGEVQADQPPQ